MQSNFKEIIKYGHTLNVLFVEDNEDVRLQLLKLLENFFSDIQIETDGQKAYENYISYHQNNNTYYDIVITDLSMPKLDGVELSKKIISQNPNQLIVVISAHTESNKLLQLIDLGIYKFLQKPVDYRDLLNNFTSIISKIKREKSYLELENKIKTIKNDNKKLHELVITDKLTSIYNRRFIDSILIQKIADLNAREENKNLSIIFVDIDDFKQINDKHGHLLGDDVLIEFAQILKINTRTNDIVGRWGGEEFIIILDRTNITQTQQIAEKLRKTIENTEFKKIKNITASFGITKYIPNDTISSLIQKADFSLYKAKEQGKNRVCTIDDLDK